MKTLLIEFNIYDSDEDEQEFDFETKSDCMSGHEVLSALNIVAGYEMGRHSLIVAKTFDMSGRDAINALRDTYEESFHKGYTMAIEEAMGDMKEEGPLDGSTGV